MICKVCFILALVCCVCECETHAVLKCKYLKKTFVEVADISCKGYPSKVIVHDGGGCERNRHD